MKRVFFFLFVIFLSLGIGKIWHWAKDGFSIPRIQGWEKVASYPPLLPEAVAALEQPYRYLGRGRQCFAFVSEDGKYVLKFPRLDRYRMPFWLRALNVSFLDRKREELAASHATREKMILNSFRISWEELREQTGLLGVHMPESVSTKHLFLIDRVGRKHEVPLEKMAFILQKKERPLLSALKTASQREKEKILSAFFDLIAEWREKKVLNKDPKFIRDIGYDGTRAYQIDIGSFYRKEGVENFLQEPAGHMREWLVQ